MSSTLPGVGAEPGGRTPAEARRAWRWLALGAATGIVAGLLAVRGAAGGAAGALPAGAAARVDGRTIPREELARALESVAADRRSPLGPEDRARILGRLVDEELLVQHALAEGALARDRAVRDGVVRAMVDAAVAEAASRAPDEAALRAFYQRRAERVAAGDAPAETPLPPFEALPPPLRQRVESAYADEARDAALEAYLAELRARAAIELASPGGR